MPNGGFKIIEEKILKCCKNPINYYTVVTLKYKGKNQRFYVHRLVAEAFIPNLENKSQLNHVDGNKENNCVSNLEWCTPKENVQHAIKNKLRKTKAIIQCDKNGNYIREWESIIEASKTLNIPAPNIVNCCKGKCKIIGGFKWKYKVKMI